MARPPTRLRALLLVLLASVLCPAGLAGQATAQATVAAEGPAAGQARRPNILLVYSDDHATAALGCYGSPVAPTPNIDRLAEQGVLFENAFCTNGICAPARAVVLTGKHSHVNGVRDNNDRFDGTQPTFPVQLRAAGYQTAIIGKWHLKSDPVGFDHWDVLPDQGHYYAPDFRSAEGTRRIPGYVTSITTDLALEWLAEQRDPDRPFLLMVQHKAPHREWMPGPNQHGLFEGQTLPEPATLFDEGAGRGPAFAAQELTIARHMSLWYDLKLPPRDEAAELVGPDRWAGGRLERMTAAERAAWEAAYGPRNAAFWQADLEGEALTRWKFQRYLADYLRCVAAVDDGVGRLLGYLEQTGLAENTLVVYSSDQGFFLGEHGFYDKRFMYEPALRLPLVARWPGVTEPGTRRVELVQNLDLAPTFVQAAGLQPAADVQGRSLVPLLAGQDPDAWRTSIYYRYYELGVHAVQPHEGVRTTSHKLLHFLQPEAWELYDLRVDPDEVVNLADDGSQAEQLATLQGELARLREQYGVSDG